MGLLATIGLILLVIGLVKAVGFLWAGLIVLGIAILIEMA